MASSRILGQARGTTSFVSIYNPGTGVRALIYSINIANTSGAASDFRICVDDDGTTYDKTTTIAWNAPCNDGAIIQYDFEHGIPMNLNGGNIAVLSVVNNAHTFTVIGEEIQ